MIPIPSRRAVSDALAFVLVFSIIITAVGVVYAFGMPALLTVQDAQQTESTITAFEALAVGIDDIQQDRSPRRAMDLSMGDRSLSVRTDTSLAIRVNGTTVTTIDGAITSTGGAAPEIAYHGGAVIRQDHSGGVVRSAPQIRCHDDRAMISLVEITPARPEVSRTGSVRVVADQQSPQMSRLITPVGTTGTITLDASESPYADAWATYFSRLAEDSAWSANNATLTCTATHGTVRVTNVRVRLLR